MHGLDGWLVVQEYVQRGGWDWHSSELVTTFLLVWCILQNVAVIMGKVDGVAKQVSKHVEEFSPRHFVEASQPCCS